jgi:uncharacterized protein
MEQTDYRRAIADYIRAAAQPPDKFSHQPRLYQLARMLGEGQSFDDDVLYAAAWLHDIGVFVGHRPEAPGQLAVWDNVAYALKVVPELLASFGFPGAKASAVLEVIRTHLPSREPTSIEGVLLRDADILEQLGATGIVRTVSKVGRDTRYPTHEHALEALRKSALELPGKLKLPRACQLATRRLELMKAFLAATAAELWE